MPEGTVDREGELREILTNAIEVQLAAFKAGISFWKDWVEQTSRFVGTATDQLRAIREEDRDAKAMLLEIVDAGRASIRGMSELPRQAAFRFIEELDELESRKKGAAAASGGRSRGNRGPRATKPESARRRRPKRTARVKS